MKLIFYLALFSDFVKSPCQEPNRKEGLSEWHSFFHHKRAIFFDREGGRLRSILMELNITTWHRINVIKGMHRLNKPVFR